MKSVILSKKTRKKKQYTDYTENQKLIPECPPLGGAEGSYAFIDPAYEEKNIY